MALPAGITTAALTAGIPTDFGGGAVVMSSMAVTPSTDVTWSATGDPLVAFGMSANGQPGQPVSVPVPHVDQDGFTRSGQPITMWAYRVVITWRNVRTGEERTRVHSAVQPTVGQTVIDLDTLPDQTPAEIVGGSVPFVSSVNGMSGAVVIDSGGAGLPDVLYVDPTTGNDANTGRSPATAKSTIQSAVNAVAADTPTTVYLSTGVHNVGSGVSIPKTCIALFEGTMGKPFWGSGGTEVTGTGAFLFTIAGDTVANSYGGAFRGIAFNLNGVSTGAVKCTNRGQLRASDVFGIDPGATAGAGTKMLFVAETTASAGADAAWLHIRDAATINCGLYSGTGSNNYLDVDQVTVHGAATGVRVDGGTQTRVNGNFETCGVGVHISNTRGALLSLAGETTPIMALLDDVPGANITVNSAGGVGDSTVKLVGDCTGTVVDGASQSGGLDLSQATGTGDLVILSPRYGRSVPYLARGAAQVHRWDQSRGVPILPDYMPDALIGTQLTAEYWTGTAWAAWSTDTTPLHTSTPSHSITVDYTHRRCRLRTTERLFGAAGLLYLQWYAPVTLTGITVRTYDASMVQTSARTFSDLVESYGVQLVMGASEYLEVEWDAPMTSGQTGNLERLHLWSSNTTSTTGGRGIIRGRTEPEGVIYGNPGDVYQRSSGGNGLWVKTGWASTTGWRRLHELPATLPTLPAAATDAATTQTLANSLRSALIALGLAT